MLSQDRQELVTRVSHLEDENAQLREQISEQESLAAAARDELARYHEQAHAVVEQWKKSTAAAWQKAAEADTRAETAETSCARLTATLESHTQTISVLTNTNDTLEQELQRVKEQLRGLLDDGHASLQTVATLREQLVAMQAAEASARADAEDTLQLLQSYRQKLDDAALRAEAESSHAHAAYEKAELLEHEYRNALALAEENAQRLANALGLLEAAQNDTAAAKEESSKLRQTVSDLEVANQHLSADRQRMMSDYDALVLRCDQERIRAEAAEAAKAGLDEDLLEVQDTNVTLERALQSLQEDYKECREQLQNSEKRLEDECATTKRLQGSLDAITAEAESNAALLHQSRTAAAEQQELFVALVRSSAAMQEELLAKQAEVAAQRHSISTLEEQLSAQKVLAESAGHRVSVLESDAHALHGRVEEVQGELHTAISQVDAANTMIHDLNTAIEAMQRDRAAAEALFASEKHLLEVQCLQVQEQCATVTQQLSEASAAATRTAAERDLYRKELLDLRREQLRLEQQVSLQVEQLQSEADELRSDKQELESGFITAKQQAETLEHELSVARDTIARLMGEARSLTESRAALQSAQDTLSARCSQLCGQNATMREQLESLVAEKEEWRQQLRQAEATLRSTDSNRAALLEQLEKASADVRQARVESNKNAERVEQLQKAYRERSERDREALDRFVTEQKAERDELVKKYNALYEAHKELKQQKERTAAGTAADGGNAGTVSLDTTLRLQLSEAATQLRSLSTLCRAQESELQQLRNDVAVFHRALDSQLQRAELIDVGQALRDRSVTVHQLDTREGPRRHPARRRSESSGSEASRNGPAPGPGQGSAVPTYGLVYNGSALSFSAQGAAGSGSSAPLSEPSAHGYASTKSARRVTHVPFDEHCVNRQ